MPDTLPYSEVVKLEGFLWEECMARLPHALDCAAWINVIGPEDRTLDDTASENLTPGDMVLGLEVDFWDELPRVKFYADDIRKYNQDRDGCLELFDGYAKTYVDKIDNGQDRHWLKKATETVDTSVGKRPEWLVEWQASLTEQ